MKTLGEYIRTSKIGERYLSAYPPTEVKICPDCGAEMKVFFKFVEGKCIQTSDPSEAEITHLSNFCFCPEGQAKQGAHFVGVGQTNDKAIVQQLTLKLNSDRYNNLRFSTWDKSRNGEHSYNSFNAVDTWAAHVSNNATSKWLWLHGSNGLGKTHLAIAAVRKIAAVRMVQPSVAVWPEVVAQERESWGRVTSPPNWQQIKTAGVLLIDDIDKVSAYGSIMEKLFTIINYRSEHKKPTIITANRSIEELRQWLAGNKDTSVVDNSRAILSRVVGVLYSEVKFVGNDQRKRGNND